MMAERKLGLVLEGGGAKGAYQFGALKLFHERGIVFDCVAGTSVGGLNAALFVAGKLEDGEKIWSNLNQDSIYPFRVSAWLGKIIGFVLVVVSGGVRYFQGGLELPVALVWRWTLAAIAICTLGSTYFFGSRLVTGPIGLVLAMLATALSLVALAVAVGRRHVAYVNAVLLVVVGVFGITFLLGILGLIAFTVGPYLSERLSIAFGMAVAIFFAPLGITAAAFAIFLYRALGRAVLAQNVMASAPLRKELDRIMWGVTLSVPTYVTVAEYRKLGDPDNQFVVRTPIGMFREILGVHRRGNPETEIHVPRAFVPHYLRVSELEHDDLVNALLATAALPLGLVRAVELKDKTFVDGGIVDNRPLFPLVSLCDCVDIMIVCLKPMSAQLQSEKQRWQELQRLIDLSRYDWEEASKQPYWFLPVKNDPPTRCPYREPKKWPKIHILAPSASLGCFVDGTMNFDATYTRPLISRGYDDAKRFLEANERLFAQ